MKKITGLLALPRISRNGNFYFPEELAKADGNSSVEMESYSR